MRATALGSSATLVPAFLGSTLLAVWSLLTPEAWAQSFGGVGGTNFKDDPYASSAPGQIWDCYFDWALRDRFMRLPQSMDNLIGLVRKVENHPIAFSWDIEKVTAVLLKRFRLDGIFFRPPDNRNPTSDMVNLYDGILEEMKKLELLHKLAPDHRADEFPEEALTAEEKCALHFMLSYSLNDTLRPDERDRGMSPSGSGGSSIGRRRRDIGDWLTGGSSDDVEEEESASSKPDLTLRMANNVGGSLRDDADTSLLRSNSGQLQSMAQQSASQARQGSQPYNYQQSQYPLEYGVVYSKYGTVAAGTVMAGISFGLQDRYLRVESLLPDNRDYTGWPTQMMNANVFNYYAGTIAGDIAQSAVHKGGNLNDPLIGPGGKWNDTVLPTEYSLDVDRTRISFMTHAEVLGGIDGLILARKIKDWDQPYVKLSHILELYYSPRGVSLGRPSPSTSGQNEDGSLTQKKFRACDRFALMRDENVVKKLEFEEQARAFAYALYADHRPIATQALEVVNKGVDKVLKEFWRFVESEGSGMNSDWACPYEVTGGLSASKKDNLPVDTRVDLHVMIDSDSQEQDRYGAMYAISQALSMMQVDGVGTNRVGLNMTQSDAWQCFLDLGEEPNKAMVAHKLLRAERWGYSARFDIKNALAAIKNDYDLFTTTEFRENSGGGNAKVFLLVIPKNRPQGTEKEMEELFEQFYEDHPDIELIFLTRNTEWRRYVRDDSKNFINLNTYNLGEKLYERLKEIPARLTFPRCKDGRDYESGNKFEGYFTPGTRQTLAYNAHYFFSSGTTVLKVRFTQKLPIEICVRRDLDNDDRDIMCGKVSDSSDNSVEFHVKAKCGRKCRPFYVTMVMDPAVDAAAYAPVCSDERVCAFPDQVKFEITHESMRCNSAHGLPGASPVAVVFAVLLASVVPLFSRHAVTFRSG